MNHQFQDRYQKDTKYKYQYYHMFNNQYYMVLNMYLKLYGKLRKQYYRRNHKYHRYVWTLHLNIRCSLQRYHIFNNFHDIQSNMM